MLVFTQLARSDPRPRDLLYTDRDLLKLTKHTLQSGGDLIDFHHYTHDSLGRRTRTDVMGGTHWEYAYNDRSELIGADRKWNATDFVFGMQYDYAYDNIGNRLSASSGGTTAGTSLRTDTYLANELNQHTTRTNAGYLHVHGQAPTGDVVMVNGTSANRYAHLYHRELSVDNSSSEAYPLIEVDHQDNGVDESGRRFVPPETEDFVYDDDGNLTRDSRWDYTWNSENRLTTMTTRMGLDTNIPQIELSFTYDYQGRRIRKIVAEETGSGYDPVSTNFFLYNGPPSSATRDYGAAGWNLIAELDHALEPIRTYAWGADLSGTLQGAGGVGGLLSIDNGSTNWFTAYDGNGNLTALVDSADSSSDAVYEYDPYGNLLRSTGPAAEDNPFRFSTKYQDEESGLVYYGYRYYNPGTGRWVSRDPIEEWGGINAYSVCQNNTVGYVDLLGLQQLAPIAPIGRIGPPLLRILPDPIPRPSPVYPMPYPPIPGPYPIAPPEGVIRPHPVPPPKPDIPPLNLIDKAPESCERTCTDERYKVLQARKVAACEEPLGNCSIWTKPSERRRIWQQIDECIKARVQRERECWGGGNKGHIEQIDNLKRRRDKCKFPWEDHRPGPIA